MYIRLSRILQTGSVIFSAALRTVWADPAPGLEVRYAPEAVYRGKPLSFRFQPENGVPPGVTTNGVALALPPGRPGNPLEITLYPERSTRIEFLSGGKTSWRFQLLRPADKGPFTERDGFLERNGEPVVLLPDHRLPPPLDRRWETLRWMREKLLNRKPDLPRVHWVAPRDSGAVEGLKDLLGAEGGEWTPPDADAWFRVHGYLMALDEAPAPFVVAEVDFHDLDRGMPFHVWMAKWQFLLQRMEHLQAYGDGLLIGPVFDSAHAGWKVPCTRWLRSLAASHGLRYVDRTRGPEVWRARLRDQLREEYRLP